MQQARPVTRTHNRARRHVAVLAALAVLAAAPYALGVLLPYYVNGLHHLPLAEVAGGAHDPKDLWPQGVLGGLLQGAGLLSLLLTPLGLVAVAIGTAITLVDDVARRRASWGLAAALAGVLAVCVLGVGFMTTPLAHALMSWRLD